MSSLLLTTLFFADPFDRGRLNRVLCAAFPCHVLDRAIGHEFILGGVCSVVGGSPEIARLSIRVYPGSLFDSFL
jgi:hypothetical protein